jgi:hypothetical protein
MFGAWRLVGSSDAALGDGCVNRIDVKEGGAQQIDDEEELQSGSVEVEQNDDPGDSDDGAARWQFPRAW